MHTKFLLATAAIAAAASGFARADDADASQYAIRFDGQRTRAEVAAEAARVPTTRSQEPAGSRVLQLQKSTLDTQILRAQTIEAVRLGKIPSGERS
jgi:hypothetical protein